MISLNVSWYTPFTRVEFRISHIANNFSANANSRDMTIQYVLGPVYLWNIRSQMNLWSWKALIIYLLIGRFSLISVVWTRNQFELMFCFGCFCFDTTPSQTLRRPNFSEVLKRSKQKNHRNSFQSCVRCSVLCVCCADFIAFIINLWILCLLDTVVLFVFCFVSLWFFSFSSLSQIVQCPVISTHKKIQAN